MDLLRNWLIGIVAAAMLVSVLDTLLPKGGAGKIAKLAGGLVLLLAVVQPLLQLSEEDIGAGWEGYKEELSQYSSDLEVAEENLMEGLIAQQSATYIQDKAMTMGITCTAQVETYPDEDGTLLPYAIVITGDLTQGEQEQLTQIIATDLAIPAERQSYQGG